MAIRAGRDVLIVVAHPDDEVLWLSPLLPQATHVLASYAVAGLDPALTKGRELVRDSFPFSGFQFLGLQQADVYGQSDFLSRVPVDHGVRLMRSCRPERAERYRSNYSALLAAVDPYLGPQTDIYTHNPWGEYGHEEHIQVNHAMVTLAQRRGCSVWAWDGFSSHELVSRDVWLRADYFPDEVTGAAPSLELDVDLDALRGDPLALSTPWRVDLRRWLRPAQSQPLPSDCPRRSRARLAASASVLTPSLDCRASRVEEGALLRRRAQHPRSSSCPLGRRARRCVRATWREPVRARCESERCASSCTPSP